jgi:predicted MPP superfamily phosphohydrolase
MMGWRGIARTAVGCLAAVLGVWSFWLEPASLRNEDYEITLARWPTECDGLRIAILADLHVGSPYNGLEKLAEVVELADRAESDLVLLPGDFVIHGVLGGTFVAPETAAAVIGRLAAPAFAVLGNHDWWLDAARVRAALEQQGIPVLDDTAREVIVGTCRFWLAGVSDLWEGQHDVEGALAPIPPAAPAIVFTHNPDVFPRVPDRVAITFAGHTHGGQVYLPGLGRPIVPSEYGERYAIGHIVEEGRHLFVSPGIGTSILPVRFLVPPEISVVRLHAEVGLSFGRGNG